MRVVFQASLIVERGGLSMGKKEDFQWISGIFDEKKQREARVEIDQKERALEEAK